MEVGGQAIVLAILRLCQVLLWDCRLKNSPFFCVFKYARAVKQKVWNEAENREHNALRVCEARALRARKTLTPRFTDFFTDFEKKTDCFAVRWDCL